MNTNLLKTILLLATAAFAQATWAQDTYNGRNMRFLYTPNLSESSDPIVASQLTQLQQAGANVVAIGGWDIQQIQQNLALLRRDPVMSKFKVVLSLNGPVYDGWAANPALACTAGQEQLPNSLRALLDSVTALAIQNADIVVGYYTFDEPALPKELTGTGICKRYQELVYDRIRQIDPDSTARPIMLSNLMGKLTDEQIRYAMSANSQDVIFIDQYQYDEDSQVAQFQKWKRHDLLTDPVVYVLPAFNQASCQDPMLRSQFQPMLNSALQRVFGDNKPRTYGDAYFAYWPGPKPDFQHSIDNCASISASVIDHLSARPDLEVVSIQTTPVEFRPGDAIRFSVTIQNVGQAATPNGWHGVLLREDGKCFSSGCAWGGFTGSLQPGEKKVVDIVEDSVWRLTAGLHTYSALVDDHQVIQETRESNNERSREIAVGDKPDLVASLLLTSPTAFKPGDEVRFTVAIANRGSVATPNGWLGVLYTVDGVCPASGCPWGGVTQSLAPGETVWLNTAQFPWTAIAGEHAIQAFADDQGLIPEYTETNNLVTRSINVSDKPDLRITQVITNPVHPRLGDAVDFVATVENVGSAPAGAAWLGLLAMQNNACFSTGCVWGGLSNSSISPGQKFTLQTHKGWTPTSVGSYNLQLLIDDQDAVNESNEVNNVFSFSAEVH